jgi:hypothetical protein
VDYSINTHEEVSSPDDKVATHVTAGVHSLTLLLSKATSMKKIIETLQRTTGIIGKLEGKVEA